MPARIPWRRSLPVVVAGVASTLTLAAFAAAASATEADAETPLPLRFDQALASYERNQWPTAFEAMATLGDAGDAEAARIALLMQRHGPALYGQHFEVAPTRRAHWLELAAAARRHDPAAMGRTTALVAGERP